MPELKQNLDLTIESAATVLELKLLIEAESGIKYDTLDLIFKGAK